MKTRPHNECSTVVTCYVDEEHQHKQQQYNERYGSTIFVPFLSSPPLKEVVESKFLHCSENTLIIFDEFGHKERCRWRCRRQCLYYCFIVDTL